MLSNCDEEELEMPVMALLQELGFPTNKLQVQARVYCKTCCMTITLASTNPGEMPSTLFCDSDGSKLFPNKPEWYKHRAKEIREFKRPIPMSCFPCCSCGNSCWEDSYYCNFCGSRLSHQYGRFQSHWRDLRERREMHTS